MPGVLRKHVALDASRCHAITSDASFPEISRKGLDHADDGHFGGVVEGVVLDAEEAGGNGRHEDEAAVVFEVLVCGLADEELGSGVQIEDVVVFLLCNLFRLVPGFGPGIAHYDVDFAEGFFGFFEETGDFGDFGDVGLDGDCFRTIPKILNYLYDFFGGALGGNVVYYYGGASFAEFDCAAATDAAAGAGDEGDFAFEGGGWDRDDHF